MTEVVEQVEGTTRAVVNDAAAREQTRYEQMLAENPRQVFALDPDDPMQLLVRPERNKRPTPPIGDKSLSDLLSSMEDQSLDGVQPGQLQPARATLNDDGIPDIYIGFRRARTIQTHNRGIAADSSKRWLLDVVIDEYVLTPAQVAARTIAENAYRTDPTPLQKTEIIKDLMNDNLSGKEIAKTLNMSPASVSTYARFDLLPDNAKKALGTGRMDYSAGARFVAMLPKREELAADEDGSILTKSQERIAKAVTKLLDGGSKVKGTDVDAATRKMSGEGGGAVNSTQRKVKAILAEIDETLAEAEGDTKTRLTAFKKFVNGGTMKALVKALG